MRNYIAGYWWQEMTNGEKVIKEHPIIFSTDMVRAILDDRKTQTRRVIKPQPFTDKIFSMVDKKYRNKTQPCVGWNKGKDGMVFGDWQGFVKNAVDYCPYGQVGGRLWVRETWQVVGFSLMTDAPKALKVAYKAGDGTKVFQVAFTDWHKYSSMGYSKWRPSIHMPRWASRIDLEITGKRAERLKLPLSPEELELEGGESALEILKECEGKWVWVVSFKRG